MSNKWVGIVEATEILSRNNGRNVNPDYARNLALMNKIRMKRLAPRHFVYRREDLEAYRMGPVRKRRDKVQSSA